MKSSLNPLALVRSRTLKIITPVYPAHRRSTTGLPSVLHIPITSKRIQSYALFCQSHPITAPQWPTKSSQKTHLNTHKNNASYNVNPKRKLNPKAWTKDAREKQNHEQRIVFKWKGSRMRFLIIKSTSYFCSLLLSRAGVTCRARLALESHNKKQFPREGCSLLCPWVQNCIFWKSVRYKTLCFMWYADICIMRREVFLMICQYLLTSSSPKLTFCVRGVE